MEKRIYTKPLCWNYNVDCQILLLTQSNPPISGGEGGWTSGGGWGGNKSSSLSSQTPASSPFSNRIAGDSPFEN